MSLKYFICSDVHGHYNEWMNSLYSSNFDIENKNHIIISLGDLISKGGQQKECLKFACKLIAENRFIAIGGNHELLLEQCQLRNGFLPFNGKHECRDDCCLITDCESFDSEIDIIEALNNNEYWNTYVSHLVNYVEKGEYIFTHAWIPCYTNKLSFIADKFRYNNDWRDASYRQWSSAVWTNPFDAWSAGVIEKDKTIVCGHISTSIAYEKFNNIKNCFDIFRDNGIIALDSSVYRTHKVNILILENIDESNN